MSWLDETLEFADALALSTAATGLALVGDVVDTKVARDLGEGTPRFLVISVDTAITSAGAATLQMLLVSDAQAAIAVDGSASVHAESTAIPKATLIAGYKIMQIALPMEGVPYERYIGILQNVGTAALTAGKINAYITDEPSKWQPYPAPSQA